MRPFATRTIALVALVALLWLPSSAARAAAYRAPPLTGHVVDAAGLLSATEKLALDQRMEEIRGRTGFELVAFLVGSLDGQSIEDVAYGAFNQWRIGRAGKDNGVLLVIAPKERSVRIETGRGVGGALTDLQASDIIQRVIAPPLRDRRYGQAVAAGVDAIAATLTKGTPDAPVSQSLRLSWQSILLVGVALTLFIVMLIVSSGFRSAMWSALQFFLVLRFLGGGRRGGAGGGGSGYSGGGGSSGGGGASGGY